MQLIPCIARRERMLEGEFSPRKWKTNDCEPRQLTMKNEQAESTLVAESHREEESFTKETVGVNKSNFMIIKPKQKKLPRNIKLSLNSEKLKNRIV